MRNNSKLNDALIKHKAVKKELGRQIGESPTAHFVHRIELFRSDLPLLFIFNLFIMRNNEQCQAPAQNEQPFNAVNHHTQNFYKAIDDFFAFAHTHDYQEVNNEMLNTYLERALNEDDEYCHKHIKRVVFMATFQNKFFAELKETWLLYKKFANPKIETI